MQTPSSMDAHPVLVHPRAYSHIRPISFCSTGAGGLNHLQLEMFRKVVKAKTGKELE